MKTHLDDIEHAWFNEFYCWSYCPDTQLWYEDAKEYLPEPLQNIEKENSIFCEAILGIFSEPDKHTHDYKEIFGYLNYLENKSSEDIVDIQLHLCSKNYEIFWNFNEKFIYDLIKFIENINKREFSTCYNYEYDPIKLFVWKKDNGHVRFSIYSYKVNDENYLKLIFDVLLEKEILISKLNNVVLTFKENMHKAIKEYEKTIKQEFKIKTDDFYAKYFFPEYIEN